MTKDDPDMDKISEELDEALKRVDVAMAQLKEVHERLLKSIDDLGDEQRKKDALIAYGSKLIGSALGFGPTIHHPQAEEEAAASVRLDKKDGQQTPR